MTNLRQRLETMWITVDGTMADHLTKDDVERIISHCKEWALDMVGEDEPILPSDEEIGTSGSIEWANLARAEIRERIQKYGTQHKWREAPTGGEYCDDCGDIRIPGVYE